MSKRKKRFFVSIFVILVLLTIFLVVVFSKKEKLVYSDNDKRETLISYLSSPDFANIDFSEQLTNTKAKLEIYQQDEKQLYFSISKNDFNSKNTIKKLCLNEKKVEFAKLFKNVLRLGEFSYNDTAALFFRFPDSLLRLPKKIEFKIKFNPFLYTVSDKELFDFISNKTVYGGDYYMTKHGRDLESVYSMNHGVMVAMKNEPSLQRFVKKIIRGCKTKEQKIQSLLTFTTNQIAYNNSEANLNGEMLKRPNEVLMTKSSDCSGKTILFASFLEQINAEYRLAYLKGHICVFVKGNFNAKNGYEMIIDNEKFYLAETTCPDFIIGKTILEETYNFNYVEFTQKVGRPSIVTNNFSKKKFEL